MPTRRDFLAACGATAPFLYGLPRALAGNWLNGFGRPADDRVLILIRLGGGNDGLNTVIPVEDDRYHRARPTLAISRQNALPLAEGLALHPSLTGFKGLWDDGLLSVVNSVGYPRPDRSHFRSMDIWQSARPDREDRTSGWLGRALDQHPDGPSDEIPGVAVLRDEMPLALVGNRYVTPALPDLDRLTLEEPLAGRLVEIPRDISASALDHVAAVADSAVAVASRVESNRSQVAWDAFPGSRLGRDLATVLTLMRSGLGTRVFYAAHDGFDTHSQQKDNHAGLLRDLGDSVAALFRELKNSGDLDRVLLVTFSEFGRRVAENGSQGTDHGAAAPLFAVSGALLPGLIGGPPDLEELDDGDVIHRIDFRRVYASLLDHWLSIDSKIVLGERFDPVPMLRERA